MFNKEMGEKSILITNKMVWVFINNIVHATTSINAGIYRGATCLCNLCYMRDNILLYYYMIYSK